MIQVKQGIHPEAKRATEIVDRGKVKQAEGKIDPIQATFYTGMRYGI